MLEWHYYSTCNYDLLVAKMPCMHVETIIVKSTARATFALIMAELESFPSRRDHRDAHGHFAAGSSDNPCRPHAGASAGGPVLECCVGFVLPSNIGGSLG